jgi:hypothetical protein
MNEKEKIKIEKLIPLLGYSSMILGYFSLITLGFGVYYLPFLVDSGNCFLSISLVLSILALSFSIVVLKRINNNNMVINKIIPIIGFVFSCIPLVIIATVIIALLLPVI